MKRTLEVFLGLAVVIAVSAMVSVSLAPVSDASEVVARYVEVRTDKNVGSGTVIRTAHGVEVLTAAHVVDGHPTATLIKKTSVSAVRTWIADVVAINRATDLAVLKPRDSAGLVARRYHGSDAGVVLVPGEPAWYCGTPMGFHAALERTIINNPRWSTPVGEFIAVNGNGWYGHSGSGLYVRRNNKFVLVGVVSQLSWRDARTPVLCVPMRDVYSILIGAKREVPQPCDPGVVIVPGGVFQEGRLLRQERHLLPLSLRESRRRVGLSVPV